MVILLASWIVSATGMADLLQAQLAPPVSCDSGCARWADLAADGVDINQGFANAKWSLGHPPQDSGRACAMPALDPGHHDGWCYCAHTGDNSTGSCGRRMDTPAGIAALPVSDTDVVVVFSTGLAKRHAEIEVAPKPTTQGYWTAVPAAGTATDRRFHFFLLGNLPSSTFFTYRVRVEGVDWSNSANFTSLPMQGNSVTFAIWGDMGLYAWNNVDSVIADFDANNISFAAHIGDHGYNIGDVPRGDGYFDMASAMYTRGLFVPGVGNHEYYSGDAGHRYDTYTQGIRMLNPSGNSRFFSLNAGLVHLLVFDSTVWFEDPGANASDQLAFIDEDLEHVNRSITPWVILAAHHPMYCSSVSFYDDEAQARTYGKGYDKSLDAFQDCVGSGKDHVAAFRDLLEPLLLKHSVDLYVCGHEHNYEISFPVAKNRRVQSNFVNPKAPVHVVTGAGGAPEFDHFGPPAPWTRKQVGDKMSYSKVTVVDRETLIWTQLSTSYYGGDTVDQFTIQKASHGPFMREVNGQYI